MIIPDYLDVVKLLLRVVKEAEKERERVLSCAAEDDEYRRQRGEEEQQDQEWC